MAIQEWCLGYNWDYTVGGGGAINFLVLGEGTCTLW